MTNVTVNKVSTLAGYNSNYGDTVSLTNVKVSGGGHVCRAFQGRNDGKEPTAIRYRWKLVVQSAHAFANKLLKYC